MCQHGLGLFSLVVEFRVFLWLKQPSFFYCEHSNKAEKLREELPTRTTGLMGVNVSLYLLRLHVFVDSPQSH